MPAAAAHALPITPSDEAHLKSRFPVTLIDAMIDDGTYRRVPEQQMNEKVDDNNGTKN